MLYFCSLDATPHSVKHRADTVLHKTKVDYFSFLVELLWLWNRYDLEAHIIDFQKWGHRVLLPPPNSTACLFQHSWICLCFSLSASLPSSPYWCWLCLPAISSPLVSWYCPWTEQNPHEQAMSWVTYLCLQRNWSPLTRFCLVLVVQLVTAHACRSVWPSSLPQTV